MSYQKKTKIKQKTKTSTPWFIWAKHVLRLLKDERKKCLLFMGTSVRQKNDPDRTYTKNCLQDQFKHYFTYLAKRVMTVLNSSHKELWYSNHLIHLFSSFIMIIIFIVYYYHHIMQFDMLYIIFIWQQREKKVTPTNHEMISRSLNDLLYIYNIVYPYRKINGYLSSRNGRNIVLGVFSGSL